MAEVNLNKAGALKALASSILADIDSSANLLYNDGPRRHLGASEIGEECYRKIWYKFRWALMPSFQPRMLRLFNRGHKEESRFNEWLSKAGYTILSLDPQTKEQWRISDVMGHFGGSTDGVCFLPDRYEITTPFLLEYKTNGTGAGFNKLKDGCAVAKPVHYDQQCVYGYKLNIQYSIYLNVNKNDECIYSEVIKLDYNRGADLIKKADIIIRSHEPPKRIAESPAAFQCKMCDFVNVCHNGLPPARNCRSCVNAKPIEEKRWHCAHFDGTIPDDFIAKGCDKWTPIT